MKVHKEKQLDENEKLMLVELEDKSLIITVVDSEGTETMLIHNVPALQNIEFAKEFFDSIEKMKS